MTDNMKKKERYAHPPSDSRHQNQGPTAPPRIGHTAMEGKRQHTKFLYALHGLHTKHLDRSLCPPVSATTQRRQTNPFPYDKIATVEGPKILRHVQHHPSARGQGGLHRMDGGHVGREASSSGKGQSVALEKCTS